ncbi:MAG: protein kinase [Lachnospiraceae bacterium]|nr:protein kinase [Lachnospiraceae bacterium]
MGEIDNKYPLALPAGTVLAGQYIVGKVLGQGGFGITYAATDHKTGKRVAVKEYFPDAMATRVERSTVLPFSGERGESFDYGRSCFLQEAETLAQFIGNENIVRIYSYFEENGTAYFVMEYVEGVAFDAYIRDHGGKIDFEDCSRILVPIMDALGAVHEKGIVHRDISPDNIYITTDGKIKLLDFGAARYSLGDKSRSLDVVLKHGFAPKEQYTRRGKQGPFTDVYALGATFYYALTGKRPPDSVERMDEDELVPPSNLGVKIGRAAESAILQALSVQPGDRFQSMAAFKMAMQESEVIEEKERIQSTVPQRFFAAPGDNAAFGPGMQQDQNAMQNAQWQDPNAMQNAQWQDPNAMRSTQWQDPNAVQNAQWQGANAQQDPNMMQNAQWQGANAQQDPNMMRSTQWQDPNAMQNAQWQGANAPQDMQAGNAFGNGSMDNAGMSAGNEIPQTGFNMPQTGNNIPQTGNGIPHTGNGIPQTGNGIPQTGNNIPQTGNGIPQMGNNIPQSGGPQAGPSGMMPEMNNGSAAVQGKKKSNTGLIIGIVAAAVVVIGLIVGGVIFFTGRDGGDAGHGGDIVAAKDTPTPAPTSTPTPRPTEPPTATPEPTEPPTPEVEAELFAQAYNVNNITNDCDVWVDDDLNLIFSDWNDNCTYSEDVDGNDIRILDHSCSSYTVIGNTMYYVSEGIAYTSNLDGSGEKVIDELSSYRDISSLLVSDTCFFVYRLQQYDSVDRRVSCIQCVVRGSGKVAGAIDLGYKYGEPVPDTRGYTFTNGYLYYVLSSPDGRSYDGGSDSTLWRVPAGDINSTPEAILHVPSPGFIKQLVSDDDYIYVSYYDTKNNPRFCMSRIYDAAIVHDQILDGSVYDIANMTVSGSDLFWCVRMVKEDRFAVIRAGISESTDEWQFTEAYDLGKINTAWIGCYTIQDMDVLFVTTKDDNGRYTLWWYYVDQPTAYGTFVQ